MALYLIGDIQGCNTAFQQLLCKIDFSPSTDTLYVLGDMVNRGEDSLGVLQTLMSLGSAAQCVLGNHDLHLLAVAHGIRNAHASDTLQAILVAPDKPAILDWLRHQKLAIQLEHKSQTWLLVHAGVLPQWSVGQTLLLAGEVEAALKNKDYLTFLHEMYGNQPSQWQDDLQSADRLRVVVNALTRLRFCNAAGVMEFDTKESATKSNEASLAPNDFMPWFDVPDRATAKENVRIAFGHWSTLGLFAKPNLNNPSVLGLDTGCVWGRELTAYEIGSSTQANAMIHSVRNSAKLAAISAPKSTNNQAT
jgi:bis(5'-nucleosyl)-tetraphosphatase (symmetrical)